MPRKSAPHRGAPSASGDPGYGSRIKNDANGAHDASPDGDLTDRSDKVGTSSLIDAAVALLERWNPAIAWVTAIPSHRPRPLLDALIERITRSRAIPFEAAFEDFAENASYLRQSELSNGTLLAQNARKMLLLRTASPRQMPSGNVLLLDDFADSRWTITVAASLLRGAGAGTVFPFVLATRFGE